MILLITKYNLSPKWVQLTILLIFYFILIKLQYINLEEHVSECMYSPQITGPEISDEDQFFSAENIDTAVQPIEPVQFSNPTPSEINEVTREVNNVTGAGVREKTAEVTHTICGVSNETICKVSSAIIVAGIGAGATLGAAGVCNIS